MAKYTVTPTCGHEYQVTLYGPHKEREKHLERASKALCGDCFRQIGQEEAREQALENNLPDLVGTEKQIQWAMKIRNEELASADGYWTELETKWSKFPEEAKLEQKEDFKNAKIFFENAMVWLRGQASAKFWIDNRGDGARLVRDSMRKQLEESQSAKAEPTASKPEPVKKQEPTAKVAISKDGSRAYVSVPYNAEMTAKIKEIPNRTWHGTQKFWSVPAAQIDELRSVVRQFFKIQGEAEVNNEPAEDQGSSSASVKPAKKQQRQLRADLADLQLPEGMRMYKVRGQKSLAVGPIKKAA